jgi:RNA polymerase-binding transcription factor DksA
MSADLSLSKYEASLREEQARLESELAELGYATATDTGLDYDSNFADTSQVTAERGESEALAKELRHSLADVVTALERIASGTYGLCAVCGKEIAPDRLEAMPAVTTCIEDAKAARN